MAEPGRRDILVGRVSSFEDMMDFGGNGEYGSDYAESTPSTYFTNSSFLPRPGPAEPEINQLTREQNQEGDFDALVSDSTFLTHAAVITPNTNNDISPSMAQSSLEIASPPVSHFSHGTSRHPYNFEPAYSVASMDAPFASIGSDIFDLYGFFGSHKDRITESMNQDQAPLASNGSSSLDSWTTLGGPPSRNSWISSSLLDNGAVFQHQPMQSDIFAENDITEILMAFASSPGFTCYDQYNNWLLSPEHHITVENAPLDPSHPVPNRVQTFLQTKTSEGQSGIVPGYIPLLPAPMELATRAASISRNQLDNLQQSEVHVLRKCRKERQRGMVRRTLTHQEREGVKNMRRTGACALCKQSKQKVSDT
jgi:hypothetical protein